MERRLAGAVLAQHGVHLAGDHVEVDVGERGHVAKTLRDAAQREDGFEHQDFTTEATAQAGARNRTVRVLYAIAIEYGTRTKTTGEESGR